MRSVFWAILTVLFLAVFVFPAFSQAVPTGPIGAFGLIGTSSPMGSIVFSGVSGPPYPPSMKWKTLTTDHHRLIFPEEYDAGALRAASITAAVQKYIEADYGNEIAPYPLVLNTSADVANGWFGLAPRMSTWYSYPSQERFGGGVDWYTLLAIHEGRHAVQFSALKRGFIGSSYFLFGQYGWTLFSFYSVPQWFFEGDAILAETAFSNGGRGRSAAFHREILAVAASEERPGYQQAYNGSFRTHFPNHYYLGYPLVAYIRLEYGEDVWNEVLKKTAALAFWPLRFHGAVKKVTGRSVPDLYEEMLDFLDAYRRDVLARDTRRFTPVIHLTEETEEWVNLLPVAGNPGTGEIFAVRYGDHYPTELVRVEMEGESAGEVKTVTAFSGKDRHVDVGPSGLLAVWVEEVPHPLWTEVSESRLVLYDIEKDRRRFLTDGEEFKHLQAPVFSPDGTMIAAVEVSPGGEGSLVILDVPDGAKLRVRVPGQAGLPQLAVGGRGADLLHPVWSEDGRRIALAGLKGGISYLLEYKRPEDSWGILAGPLDEQVTEPVYAGDFLIYGSDYGGREGIYALNCTSGERFLVADRPFAALRPLVYHRAGSRGVGVGGGNHGDTDRGRDLLVFADYDADGFRPAVVSLDEEMWTPLQEVNRRRIDYGEPLFDRMGAAEAVGTVQRAACAVVPATAEAGESAEITGYQPIAHAFNFHSWGLLPVGDGQIELFLQSDDPLGMMSFQPYAGYDHPDRIWYSGFLGTWRRFFPVLEFGASMDVREPGDPEEKKYGFTGFLGLEAPVNLSRGMWQRELFLSTAAYLRAEEADSPAAEYGLDAIVPVAVSAVFSNEYMAISPADIAAAPAQYLSLSWFEVPWQEAYSGRRLEQRGYLVFPGFFRHHLLKFSLENAWEAGEEIPLNLRLIRPRGYPVSWSDGYPIEAVAGGEYSFPLLAPDLGLGNVYYLKRITGSVFHDVGIASEGGAALAGGGTGLFQASGVEISFQQTFFNLPLIFQGGIRLIYRWRDAAVRVEDTVFSFGFEW